MGIKSKLAMLLLIILGVFSGWYFLGNLSHNSSPVLKQISNDFSVPVFVAKASGDFEAKNSLFAVNMPGQSAGSVKITREKSLTFTPTNAQLVQAKVSGNQILYANIYPSSDVSYQTTNRGIKESIIIHSLSNLPEEFSYSFNANDLKAELANDNSITFTQISKEPAKDIPVSDDSVLKAKIAANFLPEHPQRFKIPAPFMIDAKGNRSQGSDVKVILKQNSLVLIPNKDWLKKAVFPVTLDPSVETTPQIIEELAEKRTPTSKDFLNDDGTYTMVFFQNPIHYLDGQNYKDIDRAFVESSDPDYQYEVKTGLYTAKLKKSLENIVGQGDIQLDFGGGTIGFSPLKIGWSNGDQLGTVNSVQGVVSSDGSTITYPSLFDISGIDLQAIYDNEKFLKETVINNKDVIKADSHISDNLEISFALALSSDTDLKVNGKIWDKTSTIETQEAIKVLKNGQEVSDLRKAVVYGPNTKDRQSITVRLSKEGNQLVLTKIIPGSFLAKSSYPIRTDTTATIYADTTDGYLQYDSASGTMSVAQAGPPNIVDTTYAFVYSGVINDYDLGITAYESLLQFDTSSLGSGATVTSAALALSAAGAGDVSITLQARIDDWGTSLTAGDWVPGGATLQGKTLVAHYATSGGWSGYTTFADDAMAANINKTGATRLIITDKEYMVNGGNPPSSTMPYVYWASADTAGTASDPKLTITYSAAAPTATPTPSPTPVPGVTGGVQLNGGTTFSPGVTVNGN